MEKMTCSCARCSTCPLLVETGHRSNSKNTIPTHDGVSTAPHHHRSAIPPARFDRAHGRLGTGDNKCRHEPVRLKVWPPGFPGCVVADIALGGAHSLVLAHRSVTPITLANPWGTESLAYAWGYGYCGQLGLGEQVMFKLSAKGLGG